MRNIAMLAIAAIVPTLLTYGIMRENSTPQKTQAATLQAEATPILEVQNRLDKLAGVLDRYQQNNQAQLQKAHLQQSRLDKMLTDLDARLQSLETIGPELSANSVESNNLEYDADSTVSNDTDGNSKQKRVSEKNLGRWMDETLLTGYRDSESTELAREQASMNLTKTPGVILEDMECGDRFCRATFAHENGEHPAIQDLIGEPPFLSEGFTINEANGRVLLYFTGPDVTIEELRDEINEAALLDLSS